MNEQLIKTAENILDESFKQIEFLIKHSKELNNLTNGMIDTSKLNDFRSSIALVYMANQNKGILKNLSIDQIFMFLDKGFFNENLLDQKIYLLQLSYEIQ